ncbi:Clavaminate synthase-like protein [Sparassis crispa]|uniref:[histone H3]-dimethyl-L-lysine(36) demethylase n=1 Tax=Sparassis crispa TaxID=139825 RepID=A0A401GK98_9APHY|nr:Clavaminate synthase-like protein [Sparassis crispa]GBE82582.1 Clavaminate synthase-like protein [Sparassis crispa]
MKPPARKSARKRTQRDYAGLNSGTEASSDRWLRMLEGKTIQGDLFKRMKGSDVGLEWLESDENAMREPVVVESAEGLGMKMPPDTLSVDEVAELVGEDTSVEVIDVATQSNIPGWTMGKWAEYYDLEPSARDKIRNVISLEISGTNLADKVLPPRLVFYFIRPTPSNLMAYEQWSGTEMQNHSWLGDLVDEVFKVELHGGNTMFIPTGWIHAVYTPVDTLVFGGNFLHSYNVAMQLKIREIEIATHVPKKFTFPLFVRLCWYVGEKYLRDLKAKEEFSSRVLESIEALAEFLVSEARSMEHGTEQAKKETKEQVPGDRIKDAAAMARELRWRVRLAAGYSSDDEGHHRRRTQVDGSDGLGLGSKRKRGSAGAEENGELFRNFRRKEWERVEEQATETERRVMKMRRPGDGGDGWPEGWAEWKEEEEVGAEGEVVVDRRRDVVMKVRRTGSGLERQRVERIVEQWLWSPPPAESAPM